MTINLTQSFNFETDSLKSFETMLEAFVRSAYRRDALSGIPSQKKGELANLYFSTVRPGAFYDGKKRMQHPADEHGKIESYSESQFFHVCSIGSDDFGRYNGSKSVDDERTLVQLAMEHMRNADVDAFFSECGDGYDYSFNHMDGSIKEGYRMSAESNSMYPRLDLSLCHIYYGK
ncbi:TPA: hypothetical protein HA251_05840 [Candidatus Woesearchaeota archaeon]|nr:hypothetical protein [Candidatus Woesearchaeota archaeon]